jgi:hypothetical protein
LPDTGLRAPHKEEPDCCEQTGAPNEICKRGTAEKERGYANTSTERPFPRARRGWLVISLEGEVSWGSSSLVPGAQVRSGACSRGGYFFSEGF